jgi:poly(hydroxyalkanoate) depolymerase family esterase
MTLNSTATSRGNTGRSIGIVRTLTSAVLLFAIHAAALAGSWQQNQSIGGFNRVHVYTPDTSSPVGNGRALLLVLHGCTQSIDAFLTANLEDAAEAHGMVIAVPDAMNKAGFSCWSYWQGAISRGSGDYANLIALAQALASDPSKSIDADQVYISGLSSGATFAAQTGCVAPDIFAGVAPSAGPTIGTSSSGAIGTCESVSPAQFENRCRSYASAGVESFLDSQVAVVAHGTSDTTVSTCYNQQNANGYARTYGVSPVSGTTVISEGSGTADESLWQDGRVAMLWLNGLDHSWSGGSGASGSYINDASINFATYLGEFFAANNPRIDRNEAPEITGLSATASGNDTLDITGTASDADGSVVNVEIAISDIAGAAVVVEVIVANVDGSGQFSASSNVLPDALYEVSAVATDDQGENSAAATTTVRIGDPPPEQAPSLSNIDASVDGQCATITGSVVDANQNLDSVIVDFDSGSTPLGSESATLDGQLYAAGRCNLPGGSVEATVTASDATGLSSTDSISFEIDSGQTGDYNFHIAEGHITWGNGYANCYLAFGTAQFTMRESASGNGQCVWTADGDPACQGPEQACSDSSGGDPDPEPDPEPDPQCETFTTFNYLHRYAGRAYSSGSYWTPDYFAEGSNDPLPGSTYGSNTLSSSDGQTWQLGSCD